MAKFDIYQTNDESWLFMRYSFAQGHGFDMGRYKLVYQLDMPDGTGLEDVFTKLNVDHPADYHGRSLSVSDVIGYGGSLFYVDSFGFVEIEEAA